MGKRGQGLLESRPHIGHATEGTEKKQTTEDTEDTEMGREGAG